MPDDDYEKVEIGIHALVSENRRLRARIAELEAALRKNVSAGGGYQPIGIRGVPKPPPRKR
ncbi:MAG: hypothetical protein M0T84_00095 [Betaproteobacteria bacterium]|nr:hypothetical protein [Betaproteobacteria bacterium]